MIGSVEMKQAHLLYMLSIQMYISDIIIFVRNQTFPKNSWPNLLHILIVLRT